MGNSLTGPYFEGPDDEGCGVHGIVVGHIGNDRLLVRYFQWDHDKHPSVSTWQLSDHIHLVLLETRAGCHGLGNGEEEGYPEGCHDAAEAELKIRFTSIVPAPLPLSDALYSAYGAVSGIDPETFRPPF
jgi:hypothetical protein